MVPALLLCFFTTLAIGLVPVITFPASLVCSDRHCVSVESSMPRSSGDDYSSDRAAAAAQTGRIDPQRYGGFGRHVREERGTNQTAGFRLQPETIEDTIGADLW
jgi:hypothetical protein